eukprot:5754502-Pyramimonas_sp.AAC.1
MPPLGQCSELCEGLSLPAVLPGGPASLPMPPLTCHRKMCRRYRARPSIGLDWLRPRHHAWLSEESLLLLFAFWVAILRLGRFPISLVSARLRSSPRLCAPSLDAIDTRIALRGARRHIRPHVHRVRHRSCQQR